MTADEAPILAGRFRRLAAWAVDAALVPTLTILLVMIAFKAMQRTIVY
mgnify:CR=1 FL=1